MRELSEPRAVMKEESKADGAVGLANANKKALDFMFGAQRMIFDEAVFASNEMLDRARTEVHLFTEFISKMAEVHSVQGIKRMCGECSEHQIDFIRRDCERHFKHGLWMIESTSKLFGIRS